MPTWASLLLLQLFQTSLHELLPLSAALYSEFRAGPSRPPGISLGSVMLSSCTPFNLCTQLFLEGFEHGNPVDNKR
jgi:hypothetical protein